MTTAQSVSPRVYVDLDGTLIRTDMLLESLVAFIKSSLWRSFEIVRWLCRGRAYLKARLADAFEFDPATLPYNPELLAYLRDLKNRGHMLVLATATNQRLATKIAAHLGIFDDVLASDDAVNLKGEEKSKAIRRHAGEGRYLYAGNDASDLQVWSAADGAILVDCGTRVTKAAARIAPVVATFPKMPLGLHRYLRAIRVYQWAKNLLIFVPLVTAHQWTNIQAILYGATAFVAFSLCASSIYLVNDVFDLQSDRAHPRKKSRPIAAGAISIRRAAILTAVMLTAGLGLAAAVGTMFLLVTALYVLTTIAYSLIFKTYVLIDVITLACLYTFRIIGGAASIGVVPSFWLLAFSMFIFLSLALIKRCSELMHLQQTQQRAARGRDYVTGDISVIAALGVASGFAAVQVFALYINSDDVARAYQYPELLWLLCVTILYWMGRMWIKTARNEMHDDPLLFAARDRGSLVMLVLSLLIVTGAA